MASPSRVFELRTYHAVPGKLDALHDRFRDHTLPLFDKHGIAVVGFWTPKDGQDIPTDTLVYLLAFSDRDTREKRHGTPSAPTGVGTGQGRERAPERGHAHDIDRVGVPRPDGLLAAELSSATLRRSKGSLRTSRPDAI